MVGERLRGIRNTKRYCGAEPPIILQRIPVGAYDEQDPLHGQVLISDQGRILEVTRLESERKQNGVVVAS